MDDDWLSGIKLYIAEDKRIKNEYWFGNRGKVDETVHKYGEENLVED